MSGRDPRRAVAYYQTSSASNVGPDKDSLARQRRAVAAYAKAARVVVVAEFYDAAVSGADAVGERPGFAEMLELIAANGVGTVLIEDASRFARDLAVQLAGHDLLRKMGVELVAANSPEHFREDTPTATLVRQVLGAIAEFEKASLVTKMRVARERRRAETGRCEGRKPVPDEAVKLAKRLYRRHPKTKVRPSLRAVAAGLAERGHLSTSGRHYGPESVKRMLVRAASGTPCLGHGPRQP